nr:uncharacterized protein LOC128704856 isoform X2 [Cherax quadricarinatus]XP_053655983.1 uncharacterized protein LOC128704856 isoform X2 [Cherax quadricarinatus]XP_053655985.1 uncharacterized protein LOC128704856 isoform X2 [Cherax quadricarinatus]XP_053655986.1 uncharacterized protein LOC128704856 isoform X2 [Cherax quadricarinatus]
MTAWLLALTVTMVAVLGNTVALEKHQQGVREAQQHHQGVREAQQHQQGVREAQQHHQGVREAQQHHQGVREAQQHQQGLREAQQQGLWPPSEGLLLGLEEWFNSPAQRAAEGFPRMLTGNETPYDKSSALIAMSENVSVLRTATVYGIERKNYWEPGIPLSAFTSIKLC